MTDSNHEDWQDENGVWGKPLHGYSCDGIECRPMDDDFPISPPGGTRWASRIPVSSPTPDEQAAEELREYRARSRRLFTELTQERQARATDRRALVASEAALVVVREQLTRVENVLDDLDELAPPKGMTSAERQTWGWGVEQSTAAIRAALNSPPSPPTYTTEEPSWTPGLSLCPHHQDTREPREL